MNTVVAVERLGRKVLVREGNLKEVMVRELAGMHMMIGMARRRRRINERKEVLNLNEGFFFWSVNTTARHECILAR